jgi:DNA invertase Pin-like site-specific DNA recombinase
MADKLIHGTENRGDRNGQSRLTEDQVREIRRLKGSMFQREIAEKFGVTLSTVNHIYNRTTWAWLND